MVWSAWRTGIVGALKVAWQVIWFFNLLFIKFAELLLKLLLPAPIWNDYKRASDWTGQAILKRFSKTKVLRKRWPGYFGKESKHSHTEKP